MPKTYLVKVSGVPSTEAIEHLRSGVLIPEGNINARGGKRVKTAPAMVRMFKQADNPWFEVMIIEGKNRQIHKMFEAVGHRVEKIKRVKYGPLTLDIEPGKFRPLDEREVQMLKKAADHRRAQKKS